MRPADWKHGTQPAAMVVGRLVSGTTVHDSSPSMHSPATLTAPPTRPDRTNRDVLAVAGVALLCVVAMWRLAGAGPLDAAMSMVAVYILGYVTGGLLLDRSDRQAPICWGLIRLVSGLLLSSLAFLVSLALALPWYVGPGMVVAAAAVRGRAAFALPSTHGRWPRDMLIGGLLALVLAAPVIASAFRMAPGPYPPVFYSVDTPYTLEKVHALTKARSYPPESLSNAGGRPLYHYGTQAAAALLARTSGLAPHHALFLIVLPLLAAGAGAAAIVAAQWLGGAVPAAIAVPLLLVAVPSFWFSFADVVGPLVRDAWARGSVSPLVAVAGNYELWGPAWIVAPNVGSQFVVLASLAGAAASPVLGWRLPVFLVGTALAVKAPTGIVLVAGFLLAQGYRALRAGTVRPLLPALTAAAIFAATYLVLFVMPAVPPSFRVEVFPFFHLTRLVERGGVVGFIADGAWLVLPVMLAWWPLRRHPRRQEAMPLLLFALVPFAIGNATRSIDVRAGGGGASVDWLQVLLPVPALLHAFVLSYVGERWLRLGPRWRFAVAGLLALAVVPSVLVSARYVHLLATDPASGHEFADNRPIAGALAAIPIDGTRIVTNDLRYPAEAFNRDNRQMQIPALAGHQAFAVNYAYERYGFSDERQRLQALLRAETWSRALDEAARTYRWTHLLIRKDYAHPDAIPLEKIFDSETYAVYRFNR